MRHPPNIVLCVCDQLRAFEVGCYGNTAIRQPSAGIGAVAFHTMLQRISEPNLPPMHIELTTQLIVRESSGPEA